MRTISLHKERLIEVFEKQKINFETVLKYTKTTKNKSGLTVDAILENTPYKKGIKADKKEMENLNFKKHEINNSWNYTILPMENRLQEVS